MTNGQVPPPPQMPPQAPPGQPQQKKKSPWGCILIGCAVIVVLALVGGGGLVWYGWHKAKQMGFDPKLWQENPTAAAAKMVATVNPDVEVVATDKDAQTITLKNKKTGQTITVDLEEIKEGKIRFFDDEGKAATISVETEEGDDSSGTLKMETSDGSLSMASGKAAKLPDWVPAYKDMEPEHVGTLGGESGLTGGYSATVADDAETVGAWFEDKLKADGFTVKKTTMTTDNRLMVMLNGQKDNGSRSVIVSVAAEDSGCKFSVTFAEKKQP